MSKSNVKVVEIKDMETLRSSLRDYSVLRGQIGENARKMKPVTRRINGIKKAILKYMVNDNLKKVQLPNKDLLVVAETVKKPALSEKYLKDRLDTYFVDDEHRAVELLTFLQTVPAGSLQTRTMLKHLESDSYVENEGDDGSDDGVE